MRAAASQSSWLLLALALVAAVGCTQAADISENTCGNGVLDPGEDCDRPDGTCTAECRVVCRSSAPSVCPDSTTLDGTCCPSGAVCGLDGTCRTPSGTLGADVSQAFDTFDYAVADIDRDGIDDVMGVSSSAVLTRFGSVAAPLVTLDSQLAPFSNGTVAIGDLTGDGVPDVVIPTRGGLFTFETTTGTPLPVSYPASATGAAIHARIAPVLGGIFGAVIALDEQLPVTGTPSFVFTADGSNAQAPCGDPALLTAIGNLQGRTLHPYLDGTQLRVPLLIATGTAMKLCVHDMTPGGTSQEINAPSIGTGAGIEAGTDGEIFFFHSDGVPTHCPDLVFPFFDKGTQQEMTGVLPATLAAGTAGTCTVTGAAGKVFAVPGIPLATLQIQDGLHDQALVMSTGVYAIDTTAKTATLKLSSTRSWRFAVTADLNGDTFDDFVTLGTGTDIEVFRQRGGNQWSTVRIPTDGTISVVTAGDYDGDGAGDLVMATVDPVTFSAQLAVSWGALTGPFESPAPIGVFPEFYGVFTMDLSDPSLPANLDQSMDLVVANGGNQMVSTDPGKLTDLFGSGTREFQSPWTHSVAPIPGFGLVTSRADGAAAAIGHFGANNALGVLGAFDIHEAGAEVSDLVRATQLPYDDLRLDNAVHVQFGTTTGFTCGAGSGAATGTALCPNTMHLVDLPLASGDLALGFRGDDLGQASDTDCAAYFKNSAAVTSTTFATAFTSCTALLPPQDVSLADAMHGVSAARVLVGNAAAETELVLIDHTSPDSSFVWTLSYGDTGPQLTNPIDFNTEVSALMLSSGSAVRCMDATTIELGTTASDGVTYGADRELVVACLFPDARTPPNYDARVLARYSNPDPLGPPLYVPLFDLDADVGVKLRAGDFNGDHVEDLVYVSGGLGQGMVHVRLQCDAHGSSCGAQGGT